MDLFPKNYLLYWNPYIKTNGTSVSIIISIQISKMRFHYCNMNDDFSKFCGFLTKPQL